MRPALLVLLPLLSLACQEPFGTDRHDLVGLRVAGISVRATGAESVALRVAAVVEGRPWSQEPLDLTWHDATGLTVDEISELGVDGGIASGPAPEIAGTGPGTLALVARDPSNQAVWRGTVELPHVLELGADPVSVGPIEALSTQQGLDADQAGTLDLDARRDWSIGEQTDQVEPGRWARLQAPSTDGVRVRWMSTQPGGTFLEVDDQRTDWIAATYVRDDDELEDVQLEAEGWRTLLALGLDPERDGANGWSARELFVGRNVPTGLFTPSGRFLPATLPDEPGTHVQGRLVADPTSPSGLALQDALAVPATTDPGTDDLPCRAPVSGPFDPDWLLEQRCTVADVAGAVVVVEVRP